MLEERITLPKSPLTLFDGEKAFDMVYLAGGGIVHGGRCRVIAGINPKVGGQTTSPRLFWRCSPKRH